MRQPLKRNSSRAAQNSSKSFYAPVGGWNALDNLANLKEDEAVVLQNWFPEGSYCRSRGGHAEWASGLGTSVVDSLITYTGISSEKFFAAANNNIYDVTTTGVASSVVSGLTNNRWQFENYGNASGNYVFCANGADTPRQYNGTSWTTMTLSGVTPENIIMFKSYKERLFAIENNSLKFWYLPVSTISGAMTSFDLAPYCSKGGYLQFVTTWSRDAGSGADDYIVFGTSEGEIIIYTGVDPNSAADWVLNSIYEMPKPIGRRCTMRVGSDCVIVTRAGFVPLSKIMLLGLYVNKAAVSNKIEPAISSAVNTYGTNYGWQGIFYSNEDMGIFNIPIAEGSEQAQYVVNTRTGSWCEFTGMNANCWGNFGNNIFFGGNDGKVYKALVGTDDNGSNIQTTALTSYSYFGSRGRIKRWTMVRPVLRSTGSLKISTRICVDFARILPEYPDNTDETVGTEWDMGDWDTSSWGGDYVVEKHWRSVEGSGLNAALALRTSTKFQEIQWVSTDYNYELGGVI